MRRSLASSRGAVLIEFALTLPILLVLFAGMFDFGLMFQRYQVLTNAAREGARMGVLPGGYVCSPTGSSDVENRVKSYLTAGGVTETPIVTPNLVTVSPASGTPFTACRVTVQITRPLSILGPIATLLGSTFGSITLSAASEMRVEVAAGV